VNKDDRNVTVADAVLLTGVSVTCTRLWSVRHVFTLPSSGWSVLWLVHHGSKVFSLVLFLLDCKGQIPLRYPGRRQVRG